MRQNGRTYRRNRDLFANQYLSEHLRETASWKEVDESDLEQAFDAITELFEDNRDRVGNYTEAQLERSLIRPIFDILDVPYAVERTDGPSAHRPEYGLFETPEAADAAVDRDDFHEEAIAVADAKRWGRTLDTRGEARRDFANPSYQIHASLQETPTTWAVLTNGQKWRLYYGPTSHRLDSYYEIDLPSLLQCVETSGSLEDFKEFYLFFRREAFVPDATGKCFLDEVYEESSAYAEALGADLQDTIHEAIRVLAAGFLETNEDLDEDDLDLIHDSSLIYLYRLLFVLYAESEGRDLLPVDNDSYRDIYSLTALKRRVAAKRDESGQHYQPWQTTLWDRLDELFALIDRGSRGRGIPTDELTVPAYDGWLFRTDPGPDDRAEAQFLATHAVGDAVVAEVIDLLTRRSDDGTGPVFVDYSALDERQLGSIYEGLLEYRPAIADEPLTIDDGEYRPAEDDDRVDVEAGSVYLETDAGERKATGSYYTPEYVVEYIVDETLGPLVEEIRGELVSESGDRTHSRKQSFPGRFPDTFPDTFADTFAERIFDLKILDPAMGSGHFLVNAVDYLAREIIDAQERQNQRALETGNEAAITAPRTEEGELRDINWARRAVAQHCIYGVDLNPLATELTTATLWLRTLTADQPLASLDHHFRTGNALVGSDIEDVLAPAEEADDEDRLPPQESSDSAHQRALEHVMDRFQDLLATDNETLAGRTEIEHVYGELRNDPLYRRLIAMANVHTASKFGVDVPEDADERMAKALREDSWDDVESWDWFCSAQAMAEERRFFHWELEFPRAFYGDDGTRLANAGFDAVIGNPPWVATAGRAQISATMDRDVRSYLKATRTATEQQFDLYVAFYERFISLSRTGTTGIIVPDAILTREHNSHIRRYLLENASLTRIVNVGTVFEGVENGAAILITGEPSEAIHCADVTETTLRADPDFNRIPEQVFRSENEYRFLLHRDGATEQVVTTIERQPSLAERIRISRGEEIGKRADHLADSKGSGTRAIVPGSAIVRYGLDDDEIRHIPAAKIAKETTKYASPKLVFRQTSDALIGTYDDESHITIKSAYNIHAPEMGENGMKRLLGVLNSRLLNYYFDRKHAAYRSVFPQINQSTFESFPVPELETESGLAALVDTRLSATSNRTGLNTNLLDHLGPYEPGPILADIGRFQPADTDMLDATTEQYEKLRLGGVRTARDGSRVTIEASARYKPEDEASETDRWGYTESEYREAVTLADLSEREAALVEAFVPVAVETGYGFAGFRDNATKTISPLDRLKAITLPKPDDVADDFERYWDAVERAKELDEKIERTDNLIDETVYDLYGLTDAEIEIVEEAVEE
ncbi:Eco57I restriction-modification methylase domain-containing protein [Halanaeroarchaeum sulfurireducens]|uniref:site-specific DNA-methyltransferase (adenine-specific) n=1 Tax=Halanaeroarchaeum sulfurireducens TaxID=1604004 RepID=A0A0F7PBT4_9EURY|nr:TaqI-like C-terminal specificity domain-containing protein [Halanaeroarchaeum sulfurireducens]AKH96798.1 putative restriction/modification enzyme [Halanaeroarchaeum sulfurireducens]